MVRPGRLLPRGLAGPLRPCIGLRPPGHRPVSSLWRGAVGPRVTETRGSLRLRLRSTQVEEAMRRGRVGSPKTGKSPWALVLRWWAGAPPKRDRARRPPRLQPSASAPLPLLGLSVVPTLPRLGLVGRVANGLQRPLLDQTVMLSSSPQTRTLPRAGLAGKTRALAVGVAAGTTVAAAAVTTCPRKRARVEAEGHHTSHLIGSQPGLKSVTVGTMHPPRRWWRLLGTCSLFQWFPLAVRPAHQAPLHRTSRHPPRRVRPPHPRQWPTQSSR